MLGDIQRAGGIASLKKVDRTQIRDRSGAQVGSGGDSGAGAGSAPAAPGGGGGMADALAAALQKRKEKVSRSGKFPKFTKKYLFKDLFTDYTSQMTKTMMTIGRVGQLWAEGGISWNYKIHDIHTNSLVTKVLFFTCWGGGLTSILGRAL